MSFLSCSPSMTPYYPSATRRPSYEGLCRGGDARQTSMMAFHSGAVRASYRSPKLRSARARLRLRQDAIDRCVASSGRTFGCPSGRKIGHAEVTIGDVAKHSTRGLRTGQTNRLSASVLKALCAPLSIYGFSRQLYAKQSFGVMRSFRGPALSPLFT